jgi:hypothetical protein
MADARKCRPKRALTEFPRGSNPSRMAGASIFPCPQALGLEPVSADTRTGLCSRGEFRREKVWRGQRLGGHFWRHWPILRDRDRRQGILEGERGRPQCASVVISRQTSDELRGIADMRMSAAHTPQRTISGGSRSVEFVSTVLSRTIAVSNPFRRYTIARSTPNLRAASAPAPPALIRSTASRR